MEEFTEYNFTYTFRFPEGREHSFDIAISKEHVNLIMPERSEYPAWTELDDCKCPNCPLDSSQVKHCPMAVSIIDVVESFKDVFSYEEVEITIKSNDRGYYKKGALQEGLSSIMGLYMATSGCPNLTKLRPMAANHLPFATLDETIYRVLSMYALAQLFKDRNTHTYDSEFTELKELYKNISIVNAQFCQRLRHLEQKDANLNAVVILNNFAEFVPFSIGEDMLEDLHKLFEAYLD